MASTDFSENALVEQPAIALFEELGWPSANCFYEKVGPANSNAGNSTLGRETTNDVILRPKLISGQLNVEELDIDAGEPLVEAAP